MTKLGILALTIALSGGQESSRQVIPKVALSKYLVELKFEGMYVGDINLKKKPPLKVAKAAQPSVHTVTLKFFPKPQRQNGRYEMKLGSHTVTGEWNVHDGHWVNLWIDQIDRTVLSFPHALTFRAPRFVDDSWVAKDIISAAEFPLRGLLVMSNVGASKYWQRKSGSQLRPSRTEIEIQSDGL